MLNLDGYITLTDFGLSKQNVNKSHRTNSFCGTPDYIPPEIIKQDEPYSQEVDLWSFGVFLYEILCGYCPFKGHNTQELYNNIINSCDKQEISYPMCVSVSARDLINKLLTKASNRITISEIKSHEFFKGISWEDLLQKKIKPPFKPRVSDEEDTKYFVNYNYNTHTNNNNNNIEEEEMSFTTTMCSELNEDPFDGFSFNESNHTCNINDELTFNDVDNVF